MVIKYYTNREMSSNLGINLAKWKRWSREFLPPDPLGGMQSGYARQYGFNNAFTVFLGGYLVSALKFTIPEAVQVLQDLDKWLLDKSFYLDFGEEAAPVGDVDELVEEYRIFIRREFDKEGPLYHFFYTIRGIISDNQTEYNGFPIMEERYVETIMGPGNKNSRTSIMDGTKLLEISKLSRYFSENLRRGNSNTFGI